MTERSRTGVLFATTAFLIWGLSPLFWKLLVQLSPLELVAHRTVWAFLLLAVWVSLRRRWPEVHEALARPGTRLALASSTVLIGANWLVYIYAVASDQILEASLGYFINPLVSVLLGVVVLHERLNRVQTAAVALAAGGVAVLTAGHGRFPWIALVLALSFGLYGLVRKTMHADAVVGLLVETAALSPAAVAYAAWLGLRGTGAVGHSSVTIYALLVASGAITAVPLVLFTLGARRLPLSVLGLLQYIAPTSQFLLAVFLYGETFTALHGVTFAFIWSGLALFTWDLRRRTRPAPVEIA